MKIKYIVIVLMILIFINIIFLINPIKEWNKVFNFIKKFPMNERQTQIIRYSGYDNVVQFVRYDSIYEGNIGVIPLISTFDVKFSEFYLLSAISNHKIYLPPLHILLNKDFCTEKNIYKFIIMKDRKMTVINADSLWEENCKLINAFIKNDSIYVHWQYPSHKHMRLYISDAEGHLIRDMPIPANPFGDSIYSYKLYMKSDDMMYWTVSKMSFVKFSTKIGTIND